MSLFQKLQILTPRKAALAGIVLASAACGGGGGGGGGGQDPDTEAPTVEIASPGPVTVNGMQTISGTADDNRGVDSSVVYVNNSRLGKSVGSSYSISWNTANTPNGPAAIRVDAYDPSHNKGTATRNVTVNNVAPVPTVKITSQQLIPTNPVAGTTYNATAQASATNTPAVDSIAGVAPDGTRKKSNGSTFNQTYNATNSGNFTFIAYATGAKPDTVITPLTVQTPAGPTARNFNASFIEAGQQVVDLDTLTTGNAARTYSLGTIPAGLSAVLNGSKVTVTGAAANGVAADDQSGNFVFNYTVRNPDNQSATAQGGASIAEKPDMYFTGKDRLDDGTLASFDIMVNGQRYTVTGTTKVQTESGLVTLGLVQAQANVHNFQHYKFSDGRNPVVLSELTTSYQTTNGTADVNVEVGGLSKATGRHPEFEGGSYAAFKAAWPHGINTPIGVNRLVTFAKGSIGGGIFGCDQADMTSAQLAGAAEATDSLMKYVHNVWPNAIAVVSQTVPERDPIDNGVKTGDYLFCPGNVGNAGIIRNGLVVAGIARDRAAAASSIFLENAPSLFGNEGFEPPGTTGYTIMDQVPQSAYPFPLDKAVNMLMKKVGLDGKLQDKSNLQF